MAFGRKTHGSNCPDHPAVGDRCDFFGYIEGCATQGASLQNGIVFSPAIVYFPTMHKTQRLPFRRIASFFHLTAT